MPESIVIDRILRRLTWSQRTAVDRHIDGCDACLQLIVSLERALVDASAEVAGNAIAPARRRDERAPDRRAAPRRTLERRAAAPRRSATSIADSVAAAVAGAACAEDKVAAAIADHAQARIAAAADPPRLDRTMTDVGEVAAEGTDPSALDPVLLDAVAAVLDAAAAVGAAPARPRDAAADEEEIDELDVIDLIEVEPEVSRPSLRVVDGAARRPRPPSTPSMRGPSRGQRPITQPPAPPAHYPEPLASVAAQVAAASAHGATGDEPAAAAAPDPAAPIAALAEGSEPTAAPPVRPRARTSPPPAPSTEPLSGTGDGRVHLPIDQRPLSRGDTVGRYVVQSQLGTGGMGIVYAAYDPRLRRKVALKLVHLPPIDDHDRASLGARLAREAQALARLRHPNVTAIYDAGTVGDHVYIAMELHAGVTLTRWLREQPRPWREIRQVFLAAGRGLAAAHERGLVHRDFKPDNVMVGPDLEVSVTDFGLARGGWRREPDEPSVIDRTLGDQVLTPPGTLIGTLAYMAPEVAAGLAADALSDQFSFAAALHEALTGHRPVGLPIRKRPFPRASGRVPRRIRRVIARGLASEPGRRFPSVAAMLEALADDGRRAGRVRRALGVAAGAAVLGAAALGAWHIAPRLVPADESTVLPTPLAFAVTSERAASCHPGRTGLAGVWDEPRRQAVRRTMLASRALFAPSAWRAVERNLDRYAAEWSALVGESCAGEIAVDDPTESIRALRRACLAQRRDDLAQAAALLAEPWVPVDRAGQIATALPPLASCVDDSALAVQHGRAVDPAVATRVAGLRRQLFAAKARSDAGLDADGAAMARALIGPVRESGHAPLYAQLLFRLGVMEASAGHTAAAERALYDGLFAAEDGHDDELIAKAWSLLVLVVGALEDRRSEGERIARHAEAAVARLTARSPRLGDEARGKLYASQSALLAEADPAAAVRVGEQAIALFEKSFGPTAPGTAHLHRQLAATLARLDRFAEAVAHHDRAAAIVRAALGEGHPDLIELDSESGAWLAALGRDDEAGERLERAAADAELVHGPASRPLMIALERLVALRHRQGDRREALGLLDRALAIRAALPPRPVGEGVAPLSRRADLLSELSRPKAAERAYLVALAASEQAYGATSAALIAPLRKLAALSPRLGAPRRAVPPLERALAIAELRGDRRSAGEVRADLAVALGQLGQRSRARSLARRARADLAPLPDAVEQVGSIDRWLLAHPPARDGSRERPLLTGEGRRGRIKD